MKESRPTESWKKMKPAQRVLLITSTIAPAADTYALKVVDSAPRLAEYCNALRFYIGLLDDGHVDKIVYSDNSEYPLNVLYDIAHKSGHADRIEFLSFSSSGESIYCRYFLEMNLIDTTFKISKVLNPAVDQIVWKVTGRYIVNNIANIIATAPECFDIYVNCRNHPEKCLDFYLVAFRSGTYADLLGREINLYRATEPSGEVILRKKIDEGAFKGMTIIPRFKKTPRLTAGRRGYDGTEYRNAKETAKYFVRSLANRFMPWIWI